MLVLFHTAPANESAFAKMLAELAPDIPVRHVVHPEFLDRALAEGGMSRDNSRLAAAAMREASKLGRLTLCTCSTVGECADDAGLLRVDRPMAQAAVATGPRILLAACLETTIGPTQRLLLREGAQQVEVLLIADAWPHWQQGDQEAYWARITEAIAERIAEVDSVVLAQASMAGAAPRLASYGVPILSSPRSGLEAAIAAYRAAATA